MLADIPEWLPRAPPLSPDEVEFFSDPVSRVFVVVMVSFWFAWQYMVEVSGWLEGK